MEGEAAQGAAGGWAIQLPRVIIGPNPPKFNAAGIRPRARNEGRLPPCAGKGVIPLTPSRTAPLLGLSWRTSYPAEDGWKKLSTFMKLPRPTPFGSKGLALLLSVFPPSRLKLGMALLAGGAALSPAHAQTASYNFNSGASDFSPTTFTSNNPGGGIVTYSATGGIGGSGSFSTNGVSNQTVIFNTPLANFSGAVISTSFYFQTRATLSTGDLVGFGIFSSTTQLFDSGSNLGYKINNSNSSSLLASTWYQLSATTTNTGSTFHTTLSLQNYGSDGITLTGSPITLGSSDSAPGTLLTTSSVYVGIYGGLGTVGGGAADFQTPAIDNFSVSAIPEPSTYAALAGAAMLGLAIWRRRQR